MRIPQKHPGDTFTTRDHNRLANGINRGQIAGVVQGSGLELKDTPSGRMIGLASTLQLIPVICTAEDTPDDGLHTFSECDMEGTVVTGGKVLTSCWCVGDFSSDWDLSIATGEETFGLGFTYNGQNMVLLPMGAGNAFYYE